MRASTLLSVVTSSIDAIVQVGLDGRILSWNGSAAEMFDYAIDDLERHILDLTPEDRHDEQLQILEAVLSGQRVHPIDTLMLRREGTLVNVSIALSPTRDSAGAISGAAAIIRDITDRVGETERSASASASRRWAASRAASPTTSTTC